MLAAIVRSGEERILAIEGDRPDGSLNDVGIDLDPAIIEKANKTVPTAEAIADRVGDRALPGHGGELGLQPDLELFEERLCSLSSNAAAHLRFLAADVGLCGIYDGDAGKRLAGNRRIPGLGDLVELPPPVRPAEGKLAAPVAAKAP